MLDGQGSKSAMPLTPEDKARIKSLVANPRQRAKDEPRPKGVASQSTTRRSLFAAEYVRLGSPSKAAEAVGYEPSTGNGLLAEPAVKRMIRAERAKLRKAVGLETADVVEGWYAEATRRDKDGGSSSCRIQAWTQIGKHFGMLDAHVKVEVTDDLSPERRAMILALVLQTLVVAGPAIEYAEEVIDIYGEEEDAE